MLQFYRLGNNFNNNSNFMDNVINYGFTEPGKTKDCWEFFGDDNDDFPDLIDDMDWTQYYPKNEYQNIPDEKMFCVTASATNTLEILHKFKFGFEININDAFTAKDSGTTSKGNSMYNVAESLRKSGFVLQPEWMPNNVSWNEFYKTLTPKIKAKALESLLIYKINYKWVTPVSNENLMKAINKGPLQIAVRTDWYKKDGLWYLIKIGNSTHCITLGKIVKDEYKGCLDHYLGNETRNLEWNFFIGTALLFTLNKIEPMYIKVKGNPDIYLVADKKLVNVTDMDTYKALGSPKYIEVDNLDEFKENGSIIWVDRKIN